MQIHKPTQSLLMQVQDPLLLRALIPKSKLLPSTDFNIALKHDLETTRILKNLGFEVPSPIESYYTWPGKFTPFDHQKQMVDFLVQHKRAFNLSEMGCVDCTTEYLSPEGWRRIDLYDGGLVAQYHPTTEAIEFIKPLEYVKLPCKQMIRIQNTRGVDQLLSSEHRVLLSNGRVIPAQQIYNNYGTQSIENRSYRFRTTFNVIGTSGINLTDEEIRLQVAVNADGYQPKTRVYIRLKKVRKIERMRKLLFAANINFREVPCKPDGFMVFSFIPPMPKGFSKEWWQATQHQLEIIAEEAPLWDGTLRKANGKAFFSTKKDDADFIQYALSASGKRTTLNVTLREHLPSNNTDLYTVHASGREDSTIGIVRRDASEALEPVVRYEPSPDGYKYCFMTLSKFLLLRRNGCIFATGNTAKSAAALWAADYLMNIGQVHKCLIISPLSTLNTVWASDIFNTLMHRKCLVLHGSATERLENLEKNVDFYILNHHGVKIKELNKALQARHDIDLLIVDEGSKFKNASTDLYEYLERLISDNLRIWWLTGTPCAHSPTDVWAQVKIINPKNVPRFFGAFKRETMVQVSPFKWVPRAEAYNIAYRAMQPAIRFAKKDCITLPPLTKTDRQVPLSKEQQIAFKSMKNDMIAEFKATQAQGKPITAINAADRLIKLRQILCGTIRDPESGKYLPLDCSGRIKVLKECIEEANAKVIVIAPFKGILYSLEKELEKSWSIGILNGDVSHKARDRVIQNFKAISDPHILLCHPQVMAHGLNLTEADTTIFYAPIFSCDDYLQVIERFNRTGQKHKMTLVRLGGHSLEWEIYHAIDEKNMTQATILGMYEKVIK